jgi:regulator of protease activity HflC (stomatin/prohibitin superfamily)
MQFAPAVLVFFAFLALIVLIFVAKTLLTVRTASAGIVERFGKFNRILRPGLHVLMPFAEQAFIVDLQVKQAQFSVETKTRDNVFVQIPVSVQYVVLDDKIYESFYKLSNPQKQIESFVFNSILGHVPKLTLDETFEQQSGISVAVKVELDQIMSGFGFNILTALVTDIIPDVKVKAAMNDINAAQRSQVAAQARGEAEKILKVKQAEADPGQRHCGRAPGHYRRSEHLHRTLPAGGSGRYERGRDGARAAHAILRHPARYRHALRDSLRWRCCVPYSLSSCREAAPVGSRQTTELDSDAGPE